MHKQEPIELNGKIALIDVELIPLIRALNDAGLITRTHCSGGEDKKAWVTIQMENITWIEIRKDARFNEILLKWDRP